MAKVTWDEESSSDSKVTWDDEKDSSLKKFGKNVYGIGEGLTNFGSGLLSAPAMGLRALGEYALTDADMPTALSRAGSSADAITYHPKTNAGKDSADMFSHAYELGRSYTGRAAEAYTSFLRNMVSPP